MKSLMPTWTYLAMALAVPAWLLAVPVAAQGSHVGGGGGGGGSAAPAPSSGGSSGGGQSSGGGGSHVSGGGGGGGGSHASGGGGGASGGGRTSGVAVSRGGDRGGSSGAGARSNAGNYGGHVSHGTAQRGPGGSSSATPNSGGVNSGDRAVVRGSERGHDAAGAVPEFSRPRDGRPTIGHAVPRTGNAPGAGGGAIIVPGYYGGYFPWGFGGVGFASYYGGYWDPYGAIGGWGDPYDGYDDPGGFGQYPQRYDEGALRLKLKPRGASVYVDGSYAGVVDDFDGIFQKLHLDAGAHRVEVRMAGYDTLGFEVRIEPDHTTTYHGELTKVP